MSNATTVLGFTFDPNDDTVLLQYSFMNLVACSVIPVPLSGPMVIIAALIWGVAGGLAVNAVSTMLGAYLSLWATRNVCRPCFARALHGLGYAHQWEALDAALTEEGYQIALLIRLAPVAPMVLCNILLALTSVSRWTYCWTTLAGLIPANLPYAYGAALGLSIACEFPPKDPVMLSVTLIGFVASVLFVWKIGKIGSKMLKRHGVDGSARANEPSRQAACGSNACDMLAAPERPPGLADERSDEHPYRLLASV